MRVRDAGLAAFLVGTAWSCRAGPARASSTNAAEVAVAGEPELEPMRESRMDVPLRYDITKVLAVVERVVPTRFGSIDSVHQAGNDTRRHDAYEADRGPFTVVTDDSVFHLIATLTYQVRGFYKPPIGPTVSVSCGTSPASRPRILIELAAPLTLTAKWRLSSKTSIIRVEPATDGPSDRCRVGLFHQDMTQKMVEAARGAVERKLPYIDSTIARVDLSGRAQGWWRLLERPIRLSDGVWLALGPGSASPGPRAGRGANAHRRRGPHARPRIVAGALAPDAAVDSVPPLARDTMANGFHILMEGVVDYHTVSRALNAALRGRTVSHDNHTIVIDSLRVTPRLGGKAVARGDLSWGRERHSSAGGNAAARRAARDDHDAGSGLRSPD